MKLFVCSTEGQWAVKMPYKASLYAHITYTRSGVYTSLYPDDADDDEDGVGDDAFDSDSRARNNSLLFINFMTEILP